MVEGAAVIKANIRSPRRRRRQPPQLPRCRDFAAPRPHQDAAFVVDQRAVVDPELRGALEAAFGFRRAVNEPAADLPLAGQEGP